MMNKINKKNLCLLGLAILILFIGIPSLSFSQGKGTGVALLLGEPTGADIKTWINGNMGFSGSIGLLTSGIFHKNFPFRKEGSFRDKAHLQFAGHLLYHFFFGGTRVFPVYVGAGLRFKVFLDNSDPDENSEYDTTDRELMNNGDLISFGFRFLIGTEYILKLPKQKWGIFFELGLNAGLAPIVGGWPRVDRDDNDELVLIENSSDEGHYLPDWGANLGVRWYFKH